MTATLDDREVERLLRATLDGRADTVTSGPVLDRNASRALRGARSRRTVRWLTPLAAAAAVAAVVVSVVAVQDHGDGQGKAPATQRPSGTGAPSTGVRTSAAPKPAIKQACPTTLPAAWKNAILTSDVDVGGVGATPLSTAPDRTVVALRDGGVSPGSPRDVLLLRPGSSTARSAYQVAHPDEYSVQDAQISGHWLVVSVSSHARPPAHTIPGNSPMPNVHRLIVVDLATGTTRQVAGMRARPGQGVYIDRAVVVGGRIYWDERAKYGARTGVIKSYDLRTRTARTQYSGPLGYLVSSPGGLGGFPSTLQNVYVRFNLPPAVAAGVDPRHPLLVNTDGSSWAWIRGRHEIGWWTPARSAPTYLHVPQRLTTNGPGSLVVSGQYVFVGDSQQVVDMTSGAAAPLTGHGSPSGKFDSFEPVAAAHGILAGTHSVGTGHFVNGYWQDPQPRVLRLDTSRLPELRC